MSDYTRKPAHGTDARDRYDAAQREARKPCSCGSRLRKTMDGRCVACHPETAARYRALKQQGATP